MTVATQTCRADLAWTGVEGVFAPGFGAMKPEHVTLTYTPTGGAAQALTQGVHAAVTLDAATRIVTVTPLAMPAAPGVLRIGRQTPELQAVNFIDGQGFSSDTHEDLHDAHVMRLQEAKLLLADLGVQLTAIGQQNFAAQPIYRHEGIRALKANASLAGNWFELVQAGTPPDESNENNNLFMAPVWPAGGRQWRRVQAILAAALGAFTDLQRQALEAQAYGYRGDP
jgi:hypothetical protein